MKLRQIINLRSDALVKIIDLTSNNTIYIGRLCDDLYNCINYLDYKIISMIPSIDNECVYVLIKK